MKEKQPASGDFVLRRATLQKTFQTKRSIPNTSPEAWVSVQAESFSEMTGLLNPESPEIS